MQAFVRGITELKRDDSGKNVNRKVWICPMKAYLIEYGCAMQEYTTTERSRQEIIHSCIATTDVPEVTFILERFKGSKKNKFRACIRCPYF
ncbi:MAG: hypothetical protein K8R11_06850 [Methanococcoides sp.]|nr:hypothetical protein [Methanococcoides sp.]